MGWLNQLPQKIKRVVGGDKKTVPEGLWSKCPACQTVLYMKDLAENAEVCPNLMQKVSLKLVRM
jgi:acetyl-CoA carboxylase carboxyl transferase subunit beta